MKVRGSEVRGIDVDEKTRCEHYSSDNDIIAIKFPCCQVYYPCFHCHDELADHDRERISRDRWDEPGVLCGNCGHELTVREYLSSDSCVNCKAHFNPHCADHYHLYFEGSLPANQDRNERS